MWYHEVALLMVHQFYTIEGRQLHKEVTHGKVESNNGQSQQSRKKAMDYSIPLDCNVMTLRISFAFLVCVTNATIDLQSGPRATCYHEASKRQEL
jgi:hypothetical protein